MFFFQPFDVDVSSGSIHAAHQWLELCTAFGVDKVAVINETNGIYPNVSGDIQVEEFKTLEEFLSKYTNESILFIEKDGGKHYRMANYKKYDWICFGGTQGLPLNNMHDCARIPTKDTSLYPRQAASIILAEASQWLAR